MPAGWGHSMSCFDEYRRGITSARLMVDYFQAQGASVTRLLAGTGLAEGDLNNPNTDILARQELRLVANILAQVPDAQSHAAALGNRYHFSTYGLWGYGLVCCNTAAQALSLALNYLPLTYAFSGIGYREEGDKGFLCFTPPPLEPEVSHSVKVTRPGSPSGRPAHSRPGHAQWLLCRLVFAYPVARGP